MSAVPLVKRKPSSPLQNENDHKVQKIMANKCNLCTKTIGNNLDPVVCNSCDHRFHPNCVFINQVQEVYFTQNDIPWVCSSCYYKKIASTSKAVADLQKSVSDVKENLTTCLDHVSSISSQVASVHQELSMRVNTVESELMYCKNNVSQILSESRSNVIKVHGLSQKLFKDNEASRTYIAGLLKCLKIQVADCLFDFKWTNQNELLVYFLNSSVTAEIKSNYHEYQSSQHCGMFTEDFNELNSIPATTITISTEHTSDAETRERIDNLEIDKLSRNIKLDGIQYLATETPTLLLSYITKIFKFLDVEAECHNFVVRRVNRSSTCIVSFRDTWLRDQVFYSFMNRMKTSKTGGIPPDSLTNVPCVKNICINEHLCNSSQVINHFCYVLKRHYNKIVAFSTRRGKVVIKLNNESNWKVIHSLDDLHSILSQ